MKYFQEVEAWHATIQFLVHFILIIMRAAFMSPY